MVKVLIIDDDSQRGREIYAEINKEGIEIDMALTKQEALSKMSSILYDLVIIDIMLPDNRSAIIPCNNGGVSLLTEIESTRRIKKPLNIIGITSGDDVYNQCLETFKSKLVPLFLWDVGNNAWREQFKNKVDYLLKIDKQRPKVIKADIVLITAVEDEYNATLSLHDKWETINVPNDPSIYKMATMDIGDVEKSVLLVQLPEMGMTAAACFTTKLINTFSPDQVYMVGICGGIKDEVELGDIIVANSSWDYGSGKIKPPKADNAYYELDASPNQISINPITASTINTYKEMIISEIKTEWDVIHPEFPISPNLHIGPMPSGASVICDEEIFSSLIKPQHRKCLGLDMETYGVYYAIKNSTCRQIDFCSIKCVSDYANSEKNDNYHEVCCYFSSRFILKYIIIKEQNIGCI